MNRLMDWKLVALVTFALLAGASQSTRVLAQQTAPSTATTPTAAPQNVPSTATAATSTTSATIAATTDTATTAPAANPKWELLAPMVVEKLDNGMTFLFYPNQRAPIFSAVIRYDVGGKNESTGMTGIAHMFEHMAFKGTHHIGTTDWPAESKALEAVERAAVTYDTFRNQVQKQDTPVPQAQALLKPYREVLEKAKAEAQKYVVRNEFDEIYSREGSSDMNAQTSSDATTYFLSLPANRLELWAKMESERLSQPAMREFYSERDVVMEERRMRNDSSPVGRLWELTMAAAFTASPYHNPTIGYESDIQNLKADEAYKFFKRNYTPDRAVGALVGNFDVDKTRQLLRQTFGKIPARDKSFDPGHIIDEPPQQGERQVTLRLPATPTLLLGWHKPSAPDPADVTAEVLEQVLTGGRSSRWFEEFVKQKHMAAEVEAFTGPGDTLPNLIMVYATPQSGVPLPKLEAELRAAVVRLRTEPVTTDELSRAKKNLRADTIRALEDNMGLATRLAESAQIGHDPYYLERRLRQLEAVTPRDLTDFVAKYMVDDNLTIGAIEPPPSPESAATPTTGTAVTTGTTLNTGTAPVVIAPGTANAPTSGTR